MSSYNAWIKELTKFYNDAVERFMKEEQQNGKHRQPSTKAHGNPSDRTSNGPGTAPTFGPFPPAKFTYAAILGTISTSRPAKPKSGSYTGIRTGEVIAWRCWWVYMKDLCKPVPRLCSIAHQHLWEPGAVETGNVDAWIPMVFEDIPGGVYAWGDLNDCANRVCQMCESRNTVRLNQLPTYMTVSDFDPHRLAAGVAWGTVKLWGEVIEHQCGWRASHAKIHTIKGAVGDGFCVRELREIYGVGENAAYYGAPWQCR